MRQPLTRSQPKAPRWLTPHSTAPHPHTHTRSLIAHLNALGEGFPLQRVLQRVLACVGTPAQGFSEAEEEQLAALLPAPAAGASAASPAASARVLLEGCAYLLETAAFHNLKTAALGQALLQCGLSEAQAVVFGGVWTAGSAAVVTRLRARPLGAPLVLLGSSHRVALGLGSSAGTDLRETSAVIDLELAQGGAAAGAQREVLSLEMDRAGLADLLAKLDAIQSQVDSLT